MSSKKNESFPYRSSNVHLASISTHGLRNFERTLTDPVIDLHSLLCFKKHYKG